MDTQTLLNLGLVVLFVLIGGVFAATEIALVSLRDSQLTQLERASARGAKVAAVARDPNRFLSAVQIGVTVAGFFSAAYGGSTLAPDVAPVFTGLGVGDDAAEAVALVVMTLLIAYLSLVLGELVPKRLALQRSARVSLLVAPPLDKFATAMRPAIWLLSRSTNAVVRLVGADPNATNDELSKDELRDLVSTHEGLGEQERELLKEVFAASRTKLKEVMRPRADVEFLSGGLPLPDAVDRVTAAPYSRYPVTGENFDDIVGFLHVRDLLDLRSDDHRTVADVQREILVLPGSSRVLPAVSTMRQSGTHLAVVVDEYGGTDGIVTLEDLVEELVGEIRDEYDEPSADPISCEASPLEAGLSIEEFAERTGIELPDGAYETAAGFVIARLGRIPKPGDHVELGETTLRVEDMDGLRVARLSIHRQPTDLDVPEPRS
jgi:putative hemolysin